MGRIVRDLTDTSKSLIVAAHSQICEGHIQPKQLVDIAASCYAGSMEITLVTGNPHKLIELQAIFPASLNLVSKKIDLVEIQSLSLHEIVRYKMQQAYSVVGGPVIVEDVSAELDKLNGLPGPFVKYFNDQLGREGLYKLAGEGRIKVTCAMGYYDGETEYIADGILEGTVVPPREGEGFGFDFVLVPDGYDQTLSELGLEVKNTISHRFKAASILSELLANEHHPSSLL